MSRPSPAPDGNRLLARLAPAEYQRVLPRLEAVPLKFKQVLYKIQSPIRHAYFPRRGVLSTLIVMGDGSAIEAATVGNEGAVGLTVLLGAKMSPHQVLVQVPGDAQRVRADALVEEAVPGNPLWQLLVGYYHAFLVQVGQGVACNGLHTIRQRCCRWLLMTHDRVQGAAFPLTHEFLGMMLGVRRSSVSEVLQPLQEEGVIRSHRGRITVLNRDGLEAGVCECYRAVNDEFDRMLG